MCFLISSGIASAAKLLTVLFLLYQRSYNSAFVQLVNVDWAFLIVPFSFSPVCCTRTPTPSSYVLLIQDAPWVNVARSSFAYKWAPTFKSWPNGLSSPGFCRLSSWSDQILLLSLHHVGVKSLLQLLCNYNSLAGAFSRDSAARKPPILDNVGDSWQKLIDEGLMLILELNIFT